MSAPEPAAPKRAATPAALGWRLLAMVYDAIPLLPLALLVSAVSFVLNGMRQVTAPALQAAMLASLWLAIGTYFVVSWRRGGQTMGMRPWRLRVVADDGRPATWRALQLRYALATLSLAAAGLGFAWSLIDGERRAWHDLGSRTRLVRLEK